MLLTSLLFETILVAVLGFLDIHHTGACSVPYIREKSENEVKVIKVNSGKDVQLFCRIRSTGQIPKPGYNWLKDNQTLIPSAHQRMKLKPYKYLKIKRVKKEDAGFYTCVVVNDCGKNPHTMQLIVGGPVLDLNQNATSVAPKFTLSQDRMKQSHLAVPARNSVRLDCSADGYPRPTVRWYKDGKLFQERKGGFKLHLNRWTTVLKLKDLLPSDAGSYMCNVSNSYGWINHTYKVDVHERFRGKPVVLHMQNVTVYQGENASLTCSALSDSMPHFHWLRWFPMRSNGSANSSTSGAIESPHYEILNKDETDQHAIMPQSNGKMIDFHGEKLTLVNVTKKDEGKYTCIVANADGYVVEHAYITIQNIGFTFNPTSISSQGSQHAFTSSQGDAVVQKSMGWTSKIRYPAAVIAVSVGVIVLLIIAFGLCYWQVKKSRASSSATMQS